MPNTPLSRARTGCPWELIPHDRLPKSTVWGYSQPWRDDGTWRRIADASPRKVRVAEGRDPTPRVASIDGRTAKTTEVGGARGDDGGKKLGGRKRHVAFESPGLLRAATVTAASADDGAAAPRALGQLDRARFPRPETAWGDGKYRDHAPDAWREREETPFGVKVVDRPQGPQGFVKLPKRRVAERGLAWPGRDRRHSRDDEWSPESSEAWIRIRAIGGMSKRLAPDVSRKPTSFRYPKNKAA